MSRITVSSLLVCAALAAGLALFGTRRHVARGEFVAAPRPAPVEPAPTPPVEASFSIVRGRLGFWRIVRTFDGVWWFLSPQNRTQFLNGVTTVRPMLRGRDPLGPDYLSTDWDRRDDEGSQLRWAEATLARIRQAGFTNLGAWCSPVMHRCQVPMTRDLNVWRWVPYGARLFSPQWKSGAEAAIREQAFSLRDNHNLIGYYIDNELDWDDDAVGPRVYFDQLPDDDPNRLEVLGVIRDIWPTLDAFNRDWRTTFAQWTQLERQPKLPMSPSVGYDRLADRWLYHYARQYFQITTALIRKYDPNHLILGCRYRGWAPPQVPRAARSLTDAQSLNYYAADALLDARVFPAIAEESGQPLIISEYSFHAPDGRSGNRNRIHFPGEVPTQEARAQGYRTMTQRLARVPFVIGADWFQWMDEPPSGRLIDGEDANMGIVDVHDHPYEALIEAVRRTTPLLNPLHGGSAAAQNQTVWRDAPANSPDPAAVAGAADLIVK